jgi:hypothetical protein
MTLLDMYALVNTILTGMLTVMAVSLSNRVRRLEDQR